MSHFCLICIGVREGVANVSEQMRESRRHEMFGKLIERKTEEDAIMRTWKMDVSAKR